MKYIKLYDAYHISDADSAMSNLLDDCDFYKTSDNVYNNFENGVKWRYPSDYGLTNDIIDNLIRLQKRLPDRDVYITLPNQTVHRYYTFKKLESRRSSDVLGLYHFYTNKDVASFKDLWDGNSEEQAYFHRNKNKIISTDCSFKLSDIIKTSFFDEVRKLNSKYTIEEQSSIFARSCIEIFVSIPIDEDPEHLAIVAAKQNREDTFKKNTEDLIKKLGKPYTTQDFEEEYGSLSIDYTIQGKFDEVFIERLRELCNSINNYNLGIYEVHDDPRGNGWGKYGNSIRHFGRVPYVDAILIRFELYSTREQ